MPRRGIPHPDSRRQKRTRRRPAPRIGLRRLSGGSRLWSRSAAHDFCQASRIDRLLKDRSWHEPPA